MGHLSPTRGLGVWAVADAATKKIKHDRYLCMVVSPGHCLVSI